MTINTQNLEIQDLERQLRQADLMLERAEAAQDQALRNDTAKVGEALRECRRAAAYREEIQKALDMAQSGQITKEKEVA